MGLFLAIKAFFRAFKDPKKAQEFIENRKEKLPAETSDTSHLRLLAMLQQASRLIDFLKEDITDLDDAQIGAAVRKIHDDCSKCLEDIVTIRPVMEQNEGVMINVPHGYDPSKIKVVGNVRGDPPFVGTLVHKGWKAHKRSLPKKIGDQISEVICPAEVEVR